MATQLAKDIAKKADSEECDVEEMRGLCTKATKEDVNWHNPDDVSTLRPIPCSALLRSTLLCSTILCNTMHYL